MYENDWLRPIDGNGKVLAHLNASLGEKLDYLRIQAMLDRVDSRFEFIDRPALFDANRLLRDDGPLIVDGVSK